MASKYQTRSHYESIIGFPAPLPLRQLPTNRNVLNCYHYHRRTMPGNSSSSSIAKWVAVNICSVWEFSGIITISNSSIIRKILRLVDKFQKVNKMPIQKRGNDLFINDLEVFDSLFDVAQCNCFDSGVDRKNCKCSLKIPLYEWEFYVDQKTERKLVISNVDHDLTCILQKRSKRGEASLFREMNKKQKIQEIGEDIVCQNLSDDEISDSEEESNGDSSIEQVTSTRSRESEKMERNNNEYPILAEMADRFNSSNREVAALVNAALKDLRLLTPENTLIHSKVYRERMRARLTAKQISSTIHHTFSCIMFDGRRDRTKIIREVQNLESNQEIKCTEVEEHYTIVEEPGSNYIDHLIPNSGRAQDVAKELISFIHDNRSKESLQALGCDGCPTNIGKHSGIIRTIEVALNRPLQWLVCMLHLNELPLKHIFEHFDGTTSGPVSFTGQIGKEISKDLRLLTVINFQPIEGHVEKLPESILSQLSTDQLYLYYMSMTIQKGRGFLDHNDHVTTNSPGVLHHARWLTKANRILRLYVSTSEPPKQLKILTSFILTFYAPIWFHIKSHSSCIDGAKNLFFIIQLLKYQPEEIQHIVQPVIERNAFWAHPENVLLSAISDNDTSFKQIAISKIIQAREVVRHICQSDVRKFIPPKINFDAPNYFALIEDDAIITPPPLLSEFTDEQLIASIISPINIPLLPCHTQAVERGVKVVTEASESVYGYEARHGYILNTIKSRESYKTFHSKRDFLC